MLRISLAEGDVGQVGHRGFPPRLFEHRWGHVHPDHLARGAHGLCCRQGRPPRPGGDVQHLAPLGSPTSSTRRLAHTRI